MRVLVLAGALLALLPATSLAADAPTSTTGGATAIEQTTATIRGKVDPNSNTGVVAFFQFGGNKLYGSTTPEIALPASSKPQSVTAALTGLSPFTTYHYRVVARRGTKFYFGADKTFKTDRQPLGLSLAATPDRVSSGGATTLTGNLSGTGNEGKQVVLQALPFGATEFANQGNPQVVDASGNFSFPILSVPVNTVFRVQLPEKPEIVSPNVFVVVPIKVRMKVTRKIRRGHRATFRGTVDPASAGALVEIQKRFHGTYVTVGRTTVKSDGTSFRRRLKLYRSGTFRALVTPQINGQAGGPYIANESGSHKVKVRRR